MLRFLFSILFLGLFSMGFSQNTASVDFVIKNLGLNVNGHFNDFIVITTFNSEGVLETLSGKIKVNTIKTGIESRDKHLLKEDYFYSEKHPFISLESTLISKKSETDYSIKANLKIKGKTKPITLTVTILKATKNYKIMSNFEIKRRDFDVGGPSFIMSKKVKIKAIHFQKI